MNHNPEWPKAGKTDKKIEEAGDRAVQTITEVRKVKSKAQKSMKAPIILTIEKKDEKILKDFMDDLKAVTNATDIKFGKFDIKLI